MGRFPSLVALEKLDLALREFDADVPQIHQIPRSCGKLHFQGVAVVVVEFLQRFDDQEVDRKPDRPAPVRVASEKAAVRFSGW